MTDADRRTVRHLRLRAADAALARHAQVLLEDALRCATLPGAAEAPGRLLLVRRLALGRLAARASSQSIALHIERRWAAASTWCCHGASPAAAGAPAVWFLDALEAHVALGLRLVAGERPADWFWPLAVPGFDAARGGAAGLRRLLASLASRPEAPAAVPAWVRAFADAGRLEALAAALDERELPAVRAAARLGERRGDGVSPGQPPLPGAAPHADAAAHRPQAAAPSLGGVASPAVRGFLADALRHTGQPAAPQARAAVPKAGTALPPPSPRPVRPTGTDRPPAGRDAALPASGAVGECGVAADAPAAAPGTAGAAPSATDPVAAHDDAAARPTRAGGLLLLVRVLDRLAYGAWADAHWPNDPGAVARRLAGLLLGRLGVLPDDPAWRLADAGAWVDEDAEAGPRAEVGAEVSMDVGADAGTAAAPPIAAAAWRALDRRRVALGARRALPPPRPGMPAVDACAAAWLALVRRWLRRVAGIGLATLVARPALLALTPTHADVCAGLQTADVRVRRAGLDVDPGWVPWLGRVVAFRYDARYDRLPHVAPTAAVGGGA